MTGAPAARAADLPDVAGFRPDVPAQQAYRMLQQYAGPNRRIDAGRVSVPALGTQPLIYALVMSDGTGASAEMIELDLTLPPGPQIVWRVARKLTFLPGKELLVQNIVQSLHDKYGAEVPYGGSERLMTPGVPGMWWFTPQGNRAAVPPGIQFSDCDNIGPAATVEDSIATSGSGAALLQPLQRGRADLERCRELVKVSAQLGRNGNSDLALSLTVEVADLALEARTHDATLAILTADTQRHARQDHQQAVQRGKPTL